MTDSERLALVAIATHRGVSVAEAWDIVDNLAPDTDLRAASIAVEKAAALSAWAI